jgi:galactonate dehydratase
VVGWGEGTLEGKAGAVIACVDDFKEFILGSDPMQVEHHWQSMYVHTFYRAGPVIGSAISGIDQASMGHSRQSSGAPCLQTAGRPDGSQGRPWVLSFPSQQQGRAGPTA